MLFRFSNTTLEAVKNMFSVGNNIDNYVVLDVYEEDKEICVNLENTEKD